MAFTKYTNLDFDQIKESIKDYLRANSDFTGFDFEGSNFSVLIETLAYNAYINSINANMIVNESFLDSAALRKNVVSLAGNIGYLPRSKRAAIAEATITIPTNLRNTTLTLRAGLVATGKVEGSSYVFSVPESITTSVDDSGTAVFGTAEDPIKLYQGSYLSNTFTKDGSINQRFIINNPNIDYSTLMVNIGDANSSELGDFWSRVDNIVEIGGDSEVYFLREVGQENYEVVFGDGIFGKALENGQRITVTYIVTDGIDGNGASNLAYVGSVENSLGATVVPSANVNLNITRDAQNGASIESVDSIKYYAPRLYGAQYRTVTSRDYEGIIKEIYPNTESVSVVGGEELDPPQFGNVIISIKPINGTEVSDFDKKKIKDALKNYSISGINQQLVDLKILFVEVESSIYYNSTQVPTGEALKSTITNTLNSYAKSIDLNKFGGRFKYSKLQKVIDDTDTSITSNITNVIIRRNLNAAINQFAQYELCYGNSFYIKSEGKNIKSSGFRIFGVQDTVYMIDTPNKNSDGKLDNSGLGKISFITLIDNSNTEYNIIVDNAGTVDYRKGEIKLNTVRITETERDNRIIEIQAYPLSNDVLGLKDLYVSFDVSASKINMVKDTIASGEQTSGVGFQVTASYGNGKLFR